MSVEQRLRELRIELPAASDPAANYANCVRTGDLLFVSGKGPPAADGPPPKGKLGREFSTEQPESRPSDRRRGDLRGGLNTEEHVAMEPRISLVTLGVSDLERSVRFYRDGLGLPQRAGPDGIAFFELNGTWLSLYPREALAKDATVGMIPIVIEARDLQSVQVEPALR